jgi:hypothetical protein
MLDRLEIASPCKMRWDDLMRTSDDRVRACGGCKKHVFDVSGMTAAEVDRLILATESRACVRYFARADGTILLADCTVGSRRRAAVRYSVAGAVTAAAVGLMGYTLGQPVAQPAVRVDIVLPDDDLVSPPPPLGTDPAAATALDVTEYLGGMTSLGELREAPPPPSRKQPR